MSASLSDLFIYLFIYLFMYLFIYLIIYLFIYLFIYLLTLPKVGTMLLLTNKNQPTN